MLILVFFTDNDSDFTILSQRNISHQHALIFYIIAVTVRGKIIIHPMQQLHIIRLLPVVHLLTHVQILIPRKRGLVIPVIWDQPEFIVYDSFGHFGLAPCFLILKCCNFLCNFTDTLITRINFYRIKYLIHLNSCNAFVHNLFRTNLICDVG